MLNGFYLTIQYQGECGLIEGHAFSVLLVPITVRTCQFKHSHTHTSIVCSSASRTALLLSVNHKNVRPENNAYAFLVLCSEKEASGKERKMAIIMLH